MAIYLTKESKVLVQGMTGAEGMKHTRRMLAAGTDVVGGVNPRKAGRTVDFDNRTVPVFGSVREGIERTGADVTVVFVPPAFAEAAVVEAADAGVGLAVVITEGIPVHDSVALTAHARAKGTRVIGPNCPGLITPASPTRASSRPTSPSPAASAWSPSRARSPTNSCTNCATSASPPASASAATRSSAPATSTASPPSRTIPTPN